MQNKQQRKIWSSLCCAACCVFTLLSEPAMARRASIETPPDNSGPLHLMSASFLGGAADEEIIGCQIGLDDAVVLAGNAGPLTLKGAASSSLTGVNAAKQNPCGFLAFLAPEAKAARRLIRFDGATLRRLQADAQGALYVMGDAKIPLTLGAAQGTGTFIARISPDGGKVTGAIFPAGLVRDFGVDGNGEIIVLSWVALSRYAFGTVAPKWRATWDAQGENRPGGVTVSPETGITVVVGYGMTNTGHEPYKDPYARGFDRNGKLIYTLWNPDPKREAGTQYGGNGLMADTTGSDAGLDGRGNPVLMLFADGGNTVGMRDPFDVKNLLDASVTEGVFQRTAGFGFHGASRTSLIYEIAPDTGKPKKATWMSAWISPAHANALTIRGVTGDAAGSLFVVGDSAYGCPTLKPWYTASDGGYLGGGFLACFDANFKMRQCGYFPGASLSCVACRNNYVVVAGTATQGDTDKTGAIHDKTPLFRALQPDFGGGKQDAYFAVFKK